MPTAEQNIMCHSVRAIGNGNPENANSHCMLEGQQEQSYQCLDGIGTLLKCQARQGRCTYRSDLLNCRICCTMGMEMLNKLTAERPDQLNLLC
jgi:hypothetical protein